MDLKKIIVGQLVDDWQNAWKWLSVQFGILAAAVCSYIVTYPDQFVKVVDSFPEWARPFIGVLVGIIPIYLRMRK